MGWRSQYKPCHDRGHTLGPGIGDRSEPTESKIVECKAKRKAYEEKKNSIRVEPQEVFIIQAREELRKLLPNNDTSVGEGYPDRLGKYRDTKLSWAKRVASASGYELKLHDETQDRIRDKNKFMIAVDYQGDIPGRSGKIHKFTIVNIESINDCLQIFANLSALGYWPITWYQDRHICLKDSADLRLKMVSWGFPLEEKPKPSLNDKIKSASLQANAVSPFVNKSGKEAEPEI